MGKNVTTSLGNKTKFRQLIDNFGLPRVIITGFLLLLFISAPIVGADLATQITIPSTASAGTPFWCWPWFP